MNTFTPRIRASIALIAATLCSLASVGRAQGSGTTSYTIGASAGLAVPTGDLSNFTSSGYTIAATLGMHQALTPVAFRVEGSFTELPFQGSSSAKRRLYGFALDGLFNLGTPSTNGGLYLTGGGGLYGTHDTETIFNAGTDWNFGLNGGLGYYLPLSGFSVIFEGRVTHIFSSASQTLFPITVGVTF